MTTFTLVGPQAPAGYVRLIRGHYDHLVDSRGMRADIRNAVSCEPTLVDERYIKTAKGCGDLLFLFSRSQWEGVDGLIYLNSIDYFAVREGSPLYMLILEFCPAAFEVAPLWVSAELKPEEF